MTEANTTQGQSGTDQEAGPLDIMEHRDARAEGVPLFVAHWHIFLPTLVILVSYTIAWLYLVAAGKSDSSMARLFIIVVAVGVPLLAGYAFLRFQTIRLQINAENILCHPGWPKDMPISVPYSVIEKAIVKRGLYGHVFNGGTVVIQLTTHNRIVIADLRNPDRAVALIKQAVSRLAKKK